MIYVRKADGSLQPFKKSKIIKTCLRLKASREIAKKVADRIEKEIYDGIPTKKIIQLIFKYLKEYNPNLAHVIDLREAISAMRPKPDFEAFVAFLLQNLGYDVTRNVIVPGKCVEHEIDIIARKGDEVTMVEVKHHVNPHTYTGLHVFLEVWAAFEDIREGFKEGKHEYNFAKVLVVSNTKVSKHGKKFCECRKIAHMGWKYPPGEGLETLIEKFRLYPLTFLKKIERKEIERLGNIGIVTLKQLISEDTRSLSKLTKIRKKRIEELKEYAQKVLNV